MFHSEFHRGLVILSFTKIYCEFNRLTLGSPRDCFAGKFWREHSKSGVADAKSRTRLPHSKTNLVLIPFHIFPISMFKSLSILIAAVASAASRRAPSLFNSMLSTAAAGSSSSDIGGRRSGDDSNKLHPVSYAKANRQSLKISQERASFCKTVRLSSVDWRCDV